MPPADDNSRLDTHFMDFHDLPGISGQYFFVDSITFLSGECFPAEFKKNSFISKHLEKKFQSFNPYLTKPVTVSSLSLSCRYWSMVFLLSLINSWFRSVFSL